MQQGEEVIIARADQPVARLVPVHALKPARRFGAMKGRARVTAAFFKAIPEAELAAWGLTRVW